MGVEKLTGDELVRLYGPWARRTPSDAAELLADYPGMWWIAGGWAIDAFTGTERDHADLDVCVLVDELPVLRRHLSGRLDAWAAVGGALSPVLPDVEPAGAAADVLPDGCGQLWTRRSGTDPWEYDILLAPGSPDLWIYKRDDAFQLPMSEALWQHDGIRYLRAEIQLLYKASRRRAKDEADFAEILPYLDKNRRRWLRMALHSTLPDHPWLDRLTT